MQLNFGSNYLLKDIMHYCITYIMNTLSKVILHTYIFRAFSVNFTSQALYSSLVMLSCNLK